MFYPHCYSVLGPMIFFFDFFFIVRGKINLQKHFDCIIPHNDPVCSAYFFYAFVWELQMPFGLVLIQFADISAEWYYKQNGGKPTWRSSHEPRQWLWLFIFDVTEADFNHTSHVVVAL